jgi:hypothetical protein
MVCVFLKTLGCLGFVDVVVFVLDFVLATLAMFRGAFASTVAVVEASGNVVVVSLLVATAKADDSVMTVKAARMF